MIEIDIGTEQVMDALSNLARHTDNVRPALNEIGEYIASEIDLNFRDAQDPYGNAWAPLSPLSTLINRAGNKPLNDTGRLKNSITSNVGNDSVEIGTNVEYAATHQFGVQKDEYAPGVPWGDIPARPFLPTEEVGVPDDWADKILTIINEHLEEAL